MTHTNDFLHQVNFENARRDLKKNGYYIIENAYDQDFCSKAIEFIDTYNSESSEVNYEGSELRIWDAQKKDSLLNRFNQDCNLSMSSFLQKHMEAHTLLAIRNRPVNSSDESLKKGRWHLDSLTKQMKIFLFLTDTTESSGPFEFIPKTHTNTFKLRMLCGGAYLTLSDILSGGDRSYQKLSDDWVAKLATKGFQPTPLICKAGTMLVVDTSAIHRARPCLEECRYALTAYFR